MSMQQHSSDVSQETETATIVKTWESESSANVLVSEQCSYILCIYFFRSYYVVSHRKMILKFLYYFNLLEIESSPI